MGLFDFFKSKDDDESKIGIPSDERTSSFMRPLAFDEENNLFILEDKALAFAFQCLPLNGTSDGLQERIKELLQMEFPHDTIMQFCLFRSPDIEMELKDYRELRPTVIQDPILRDSVKSRENFLRTHTREMIETTLSNGAFYRNGIIVDLKLMVSVIIPIKNELPTSEDIERAKNISVAVKSSLTTICLCPVEVDANRYLRFISPMINWSRNAAWTNNFVGLWEPSTPLSKQVFDWDTNLEVTSEDLKLGDYAYCRVCSAKQFPEMYYFGEAAKYTGNIDGSTDSLMFPYAVCINCYFPDRDALKTSVRTKRQFTVNQAFGPIAKYSPELLDKKQSFDILDASMRDGAKAMKISGSVLVFGKTKVECESNARALMGSWREKWFTLMLDKYVQLPVFTQCLPMNANNGMSRFLFRTKTVTTDQAAVLLPIFGEWKGTGTGHLLMSSRNGQIMSFSLHDTGSNKNCVVAAQSGSGKSFFINELIVSYLSEGAQIWVIDAGKSYKKLCADFEGDFLQFDEETDIRMNPFELIEDYEDEEDTLVSLLLNMASQSGNISDIQTTGLKKALHDLWKEKGKEATIDDVSSRLLNFEDGRLKDIGTQLYPFTSEGGYGRYFKKGNNVSFKNKFTVLELDELQGKKHLRQVILLQLILQIQHDVYLGDRSRKKIVVVDEAWDLLKEGEVASFMEAAYRKFRKYNGAVLIATQSVSDLYENPVGRAIAENSATMCLLGQKPEAIESVTKKGQLELSPAYVNLLKSVHTEAGVFSEIFVKSERGYGIYRLIVDDYSKLLYSTSPDELSAIQRWVDEGYSNTEAIHKVLEERKARNS